MALIPVLTKKTLQVVNCEILVQKSIEAVVIRVDLVHSHLILFNFIFFHIFFICIDVVFEF